MRVTPARNGSGSHAGRVGKGHSARRRSQPGRFLTFVKFLPDAGLRFVKDLQKPIEQTQANHMNYVRGSAGSLIMPTREDLRNLAQMARRISANIINRDVVDRLNAIGRDFDHQADEAIDPEAPDATALEQRSPGLGGSSHPPS